MVISETMSTEVQTPIVRLQPLCRAGAGDQDIIIDMVDGTVM